MIAAGSLINNVLGLWWVTITCSLAAVASILGALRGVTQHRVPRLMLGVAVAAVAISYWWDLTGIGGGGAEMRRGAGYVLWPALLWTAWSGISYSRNRDTAITKVLGKESQ